MSCQFVSDHVDAYALGLLDPAGRERIEAHAARCEACRRLLAEARATDQAVRDALAWAEPGPEFADRIAAAVARPPRLRRWLAAAAVAAACFALFHALYRPEPVETIVWPQPQPTVAPADLVSGRVVDVLGQARGPLEGGESYVAVSDAAVADARGLFLIASGTAFETAPAAAVAMSVHSGTVLGQVSRGAEAVRVELEPASGGAEVRTRGCQFYSTTVPGESGAICVHVYAGSLELTVDHRKLALGQGDSAIVAGGEPVGSTREQVQRVERLREAVEPALLARRRRLQGQSDAYARLVAGHAQLAALDAAEAALDRLDRLRETANDELGRMVLVASATR